ncbi:uncharacterized protein LOC120278531 [Dioscorea cayenensis subsp. rotundata]|uniref:Uncharacterized protein LOC120278531 n=1 Tax=Dioscorea cayennensis subsp. rotundata TaxID=55577 RepID=A0AB40CQ95_DIOCR|nr:uncharacterized protein LOC120278531 [Dioscorea cayenensis subsp. rotundata]
MAISVNKTLPDLSKLEPLDGTNYKRWSQKLLIFFEQLEIDYVLFSDSLFIETDTNGTSSDPLATPITTPPIVQTKQVDEESKKKYEKDNKTVRGHLLNHMSNPLFDLFVTQKSAKEIWNLLEKKYGADDAGKRKYVVGKWLQFQMIDDKPIMEQVHIYENLAADVLNEGMKMCEILQANVLLEKFPPSWSDYRNQLKHKKKDLTLQELISHMRTEEANRLKDKQISSLVNIPKANLVVANEYSAKETFKHGPKKGHYQGNRKNARTRINKGGNKIEKEKDKVAVLYISLQRGIRFYDFEEAQDGECVYMGNQSKFSVGAFIEQGGSKIVLEADRVVLTKNGEFVGKGYLNEGLFVLNIANGNSSSSAYIVESVNLWHGRLGHVNIASIKRLKNLNLIPAVNVNEFSKCSVCVEAKFAKKPFKSVENRNSKLLELIHTDLADFKNTISKGGKKYYVTFIDDFSRYTKVYLLRSKDEAGEMFLKYKTEVENQLDRKIKRVRSDRGGEYNTDYLKEFCEKNGIIHELTAPYTPQQNGIAERKKIELLKNMLNAMLISSSLADNMWGGSSFRLVIFLCGFLIKGWKKPLMNYGKMLHFPNLSDAKFFESEFPLKKSNTNIDYVSLNDTSMPLSLPSSSFDNEYVDNLRCSKKAKEPKKFLS